jgi:hypothetical protein
MTDFIENQQKQEYLSNILSKVYSENKQDPYILSKIENHISQLPSIIESLKINREKNQQKTQDKITDQDSFMQSFLNKYSYFYSSSTDRFFEYDGLHYKPYAEEDILHNIFLEVSKERYLYNWKQKTKISTLKKIKDISLFKSIPNSETIQSVIDMFYPVFFSSKTQVKYFLTIMGDNILKKNQGIIYFIPSFAKTFLREIDNYAQLFIGCHTSTSFRYKYHEHGYSACRLIKINESIKIDTLFYPFLNNYFLDILCVAAHYSTRFGSADEFLKTYSNDDELMNYAFYLKDRSPQILLKDFCDEYIIRKDSAPICAWKTIQYLWKHFLESKALPTVLFQNELINWFSNNYIYDPSTKSVAGIFSKYMPAIERFLRFWEDTIEIIPITEFSEYEIDEIIILFKKWTPGINISEHQVIDFISHFLPDIETDGQKFIFNIRSTIWDKESCLKHDIDNVLVNTLNNLITQLTITDAYIYYCKSIKDNERIIVSKIYFEKVILEYLRDIIIEEKVISLELWKNNLDK